MSTKLYYLGHPADGNGWGVANTNLVRELASVCDVIVDHSDRTEFDGAVFVPIADASLRPIRPVQRAKQVFGYCFTEFPLTSAAAENSRTYSTIFTGSTWNTAKLHSAGIGHARTMIQGVDFDRFKPLPPSTPGSFVIFSGGKFEFRKAQDCVLAAVRLFMRLHADVILLAAWHNPWPATMSSMKKSHLIDSEKPLEGLPADRVFLLPAVPNAETPAIYAPAHVGLFPNRCEAGTNMVMSEFMACGRPVIATYAHGHKDVLGPGAMKLVKGETNAAGWVEPDLEEILHQLEYAYQHRAEIAERGLACAQHMQQFTWAECARTIVRELS